ncbi:hypothetical protein EV44_g3546 [Erysiphe necator]|uniref:Reverse transcriptase Ty1/copia-type domain-containing protein n=1 Tax=Uncinula necator TaxID=52586 RepID=A0A0B1NVX4_UNCNE|nr:hypothetical protein EV44_g3546 [Erysiphe necator]
MMQMMQMMQMITVFNRRLLKMMKTKQRSEETHLDNANCLLDTIRILWLRQEGKIIDEKPPFFHSRLKEIDGLLSKGVFEITTNPKTTERLFKSRFVDEIKGKASNTPFEKSRLVIQAYNDEGKINILTQSPTIQRASQRIIVCIAASTDLSLHLRDVSQAYVQSTTKLSREIFAKPPKEIQDNLPTNSVLKIKKPLYGIPEAGTHWFRNYHKHHIENLHMTQSTFDPCLLHTNKKGLFGVVGIQTDDTLFIGNEEFIRLEQDEIIKSQIVTKPVDKLMSNKNLTFNGGIINLGENSIILSPKNQGEKIKIVDMNKLNFRNEFIAQRARGAYIATLCQPEASFDLSFAAQTCQDPSDEDVKYLNKRLKWQIENKHRGLNYIKVNLNSAKLFIFVDASFANNRDYSSQIGFIIALANDKNGEINDCTFSISGNLIHWSSIKCKRVTRSVLASELYVTVHGFDSGMVIKTTLDNILKQLNLPQVPLILCTDSRSLYECLTKLGTINEKRLMIDVMALRQSYEQREITEIRWIDGRDNPADSMTKGTPCVALKNFIDTNTLKIRVDGWVEREEILV